jgi:hypothetical protein
MSSAVLRFTDAIDPDRRRRGRTIYRDTESIAFEPERSTAFAAGAFAERRVMKRGNVLSGEGSAISD